MKLRLQLTPAARLAIGLASLSVLLFLLLDFALGLMPDRSDVARKIRQSAAESIAIQTASLLPNNNLAAIRSLLETGRSRFPELQSAALRTRGGEVVASSGDHAQHWKPLSSGRSNLTAMQIPVLSGNLNWGQIELAFEPVHEGGLLGWIKEPSILGVIGLSFLGSLTYYLYLRRALHYLDPSSAVPERVRAAFDTLTEGLLVLDTRGQVVLANQVFRKLVPENAGSINGRAASDMQWLTESFGRERSSHPWNRAMAEGKTIEDENFTTKLDGFDEPRRFVVKANPILDNSGAKRGCLVTFDDVTRLHELNQIQRQTLDELELSRAEVERKNQELQRLASRDPLTGALNRRAFFDQLLTLQAEAIADAQQIAFIMCDVDHFKSFNDRFGHAVGDEVLKALSNLLTQEIGPNDLLCRLGGEEFCVAVTGLTMTEALDQAERLRNAVEQNAGRSLNMVQDLKITASFGVSCMPAGTIEPDQLLDLADQALYHAKRSGRNRVQAWPVKEPQLKAEAFVEV
jgi:diguanylate cyclase (GGDEF)-like protein